MAQLFSVCDGSMPLLCQVSSFPQLAVNFAKLPELLGRSE